MNKKEQSFFSLNLAFSYFLIQVKQLLENDDKGHVVATCRNPNGSIGLTNLKDKFAERLRILPLDVTVESSIEVLLCLLFYSSLCHLLIKYRGMSSDTKWGPDNHFGSSSASILFTLVGNLVLV